LWYSTSDSSSFHSKHSTCNNSRNSKLVKEKIKGKSKKQLTRAEEAPIATSDDNAYITWWSNKTGNEEVMFRASTDNDATFGDKINLSNTPKLIQTMQR
jgi:hypothetical protein